MPQVFAQEFNDGDSIINASKQVSQIRKFAIKNLSSKEPSAKDSESANQKYDSLLKLLTSINLNLAHVMSFSDKEDDEAISDIRISNTIISIIAQINSASILLAEIDIELLDKNKTQKLIVLVNTFYKFIRTFNSDETIFVLLRDSYIDKKFLEASNSLLQNAKVFSDYQEITRKSIDDEEYDSTKEEDDDSFMSVSDSDSDSDDDSFDPDASGDAEVLVPGAQEIRDALASFEGKLDKYRNNTDDSLAETARLKEVIASLRKEKGDKGSLLHNIALRDRETEKRRSLKKLTTETEKGIAILKSKLDSVEMSDKEGLSGSGLNLKAMKALFPMKRYL
jgi:hypothetical protein